MSKKDKTSQKQPKKRRFAPLAWMIAREISGYNDVLSIGHDISSIHHDNTHIPKKENPEQKRIRRKNNRRRVWKILMKSCGLAITFIQVGKFLKVMKVSKGMVAALTTLRVVKRADKIKKEIEQGDVIGTASAVLGAVSSVADNPIVKGVSKASTVAENIKDIASSSDGRSGTIKAAKVAQDVYEIATGEKVSDGIKNTIKNFEKINSAYTKADKELTAEDEKEQSSQEEANATVLGPRRKISKRKINIRSKTRKAIAKIRQELKSRQYPSTMGKEKTHISHLTEEEKEKRLRIKMNMRRLKEQENR